MSGSARTTCEVVEGNVMQGAVVVATQMCSSHENASSSAWAKR